MHCAMALQDCPAPMQPGPGLLVTGTQTSPLCDAHSWQVKLQSCPQQTPSMEQKPLAHWLPVVHPTPRALLQLPMPSHVCTTWHKGPPVFIGRSWHIVPMDPAHPWHWLVHGTAQQTASDEQFPLAHTPGMSQC
jgi:hypothetical protein